MIAFVDLKRQYQTIKKEVDAAFKKVCLQANFILGDEVELLEQEFARYCGVKFAVAVDSGTSALELALRAYDIGVGDEVITAANTFFATVAAITITGAKPVLVDIEEETYNLNPSLLKKVITKRTKAIIPVHLYGQPAEMKEIKKIAREYNLKVIEDACQAHGARYQGKRCGGLGDIGCFSFYPGKNLGAYGDGGMITTNSSRVAEKIKMLRNYGQKRKYHHLLVGYNRRLDTLQAAVLRIKLKRLDTWNNQRHQRASWYQEELKNLPLVLPHQKPDRDHIFHLYVIRIQKRDKLQQYLSAAGIVTVIHYPIPIHYQKAFSSLGYKKGDFPLTEKYAREILSLPMFPELKKSEVKIVARTIKSFCELNE